MKFYDSCSKRRIFRFDQFNTRNTEYISFVSKIFFNSYYSTTEIISIHMLILVQKKLSETIHESYKRLLFTMFNEVPIKLSLKSTVFHWLSLSSHLGENVALFRFTRAPLSPFPDALNFSVVRTFTPRGEIGHK